ncbi:MAG: hypothetical protein ACPGVU_22420 [Limisphaerales bacterium]
MNRLLLILFSSLVFTGLVAAQDKQQDPPEIAVLKRFVGTWDVAVTNTPVSGEARTYKVVSHRSWDDVGNTVRFEDEQPNDRPPLRLSLRYDHEVGNYPFAVEGSEQNFQIVGSWDRKASTMEFSGTLPNGADLMLSHRFVSQDKAIVSATIKNAEGVVLGKIVFHQTRRKSGD